jgi:hypothetical protein
MREYHGRRLAREDGWLRPCEQRSAVESKVAGTAGSLFQRVRRSGWQGVRSEPSEILPGRRRTQTPMATTKTSLICDGARRARKGGLAGADSGDILDEVEQTGTAVSPLEIISLGPRRQ